MFDNLLNLPMMPAGGLLGDDPLAAVRGMQPGQPMMTPQAGPQIPMHPQAAPIPSAPAAPQRQSLLGRVHDALQNGLLGPTPQGFQGLLTPDEIQGARPNLFHTLFHSDEGSASDLYQRDLTNLANRKIQAQSLAEHQQGLAKQAVMDAKRADVLSKLGAPPSDPQAFDGWARKAYGAFLSIGDMESVQHLNAVMQQIAAHEVQKPVAPQELHLGDKLALRDPATGKIVAVYPIGAAPKSASEISDDMKFHATQTNQILDDFRTETSKFDAAKQGYDVLQGAIQHPGIATPFAVLDAYARVINPGAVVRQGTMQVLQEMGAMDDRVRRWLSMAQKGQWPADMVQSVKGTLDGIMSQHAKEYDATRSRALERGRRVGVDVNPLLAPTPKFGSEALGSTTAPSGADKVRNLLRKP